MKTFANVHYNYGHVKILYKISLQIPDTLIVRENRLCLLLKEMRLGQQSFPHKTNTQINSSNIKDDASRLADL